MEDGGIQRKLAAIFSADAVGYSRLMREDEVATIKTLAEYRELMNTLILQYKGRVVDNPGDNLLAEFSSVVDAVQSAVAVQRELKARNADLPDNRRMQFRIGINIGDVIQEGDRIYGDGVNIAARLEGLAEPGGICISRMAYDQIESKLPFGYEYMGRQTVKNINKPLHAYRVLLDPEETAREKKKESRAKAEGKPFEGSKDWEEAKKRFHHVKGRVYDFTKEISEDEHVGQTFKDIKDRFRDFSEDVRGDPKRREQAFRKLIHHKHLQFFFILGGALFLINAFTSYGRWWFQYPLVSIGLVIYILWVRDSFLSSDKLEKMRERIFQVELAKLPQDSQAEERGRIETLVMVKLRFYKHLYLFMGVNAFLILLNLITNPFNWWFPFPLIGWGIALFIHWMKIKQ